MLSVELVVRFELLKEASFRAGTSANRRILFVLPTAVQSVKCLGLCRHHLFKQFSCVARVMMAYFGFFWL